MVYQISSWICRFFECLFTEEMFANTLLKVLGLLARIWLLFDTSNKIRFSCLLCCGWSKYVHLAFDFYICMQVKAGFHHSFQWSARFQKSEQKTQISIIQEANENIDTLYRNIRTHYSVLVFSSTNTMSAAGSSSSRRRKSRHEKIAPYASSS